MTSDANVYSSACPSRAVLELISGKWTLLIVPLLAKGPERNNELLRKIDGISQKMLSQTLRELETHGLVQRIDHRTVPPHVEYQLTEFGESLARVLAPLCEWGTRHTSEVTAIVQNRKRAPEAA